ncbi:hypothetical protein QQ045_014443 [Rhodiola kirilowii]
MYVSRLRCRNQKWKNFMQSSRHCYRQNYQPYPCVQTPNCNSIWSGQSTIRTYASQTLLSHGAISRTSNLWLRERQRVGLNSVLDKLRFFSSEGDGANAREDESIPVKEAENVDKGKNRKEEVKQDTKHYDAHARLGEQDQKEWLLNEKLAIECKKKESPFLSRHERFKNEFLRRVVPWEKLTVSWDSFPYYINETTKSLLIDCAASHLKQKTFAQSFGTRLTSSSARILLQSVPGTELYRERLVRALAKDLQVPLLILDSNVLAPYDFGEDYNSESESEDDDHVGEECTSEEDEDENDATNAEDWTGNTEKSGSDNEVNVELTEEVLKKFIPFNIDDLQKNLSGETEASVEATAESSSKIVGSLKRGDRVKYTGATVRVEADNRIKLGKIPTSDGSTTAFTTIRKRSLSSGQRGEVYEVNGDRVAVIVDASEQKNEQDADKTKDESVKPSIYLIHVKDLELDPEARAEDCYIAIKALCEVLQSQQPLIVYFPDSYQWLSRAVPKSNRADFVQKVQELFDQLSGPVVLICGQNKVETGSKEKEKFTMILPNLGRLAKLPLSLKRLTEGLKDTKKPEDTKISALFSNVFSIHPPKEDDLLRTFSKQVEDDRIIVVSRSNLNELHKVLEENALMCMELLHVNTDGVILTKQKAEKVVGWAKNHYLATCLLPNIKADRLYIPRESLEIAITRLRDLESLSKKPSQNLKNLAKDDYENNFVSAVVPAEEIGVRFDDIGALEDVKKALQELVILPMRRPELFAHGNLLRPCKGILLFGPPGTGKTLLAKALATEAGANFISITGSTLTSKWFGDAEKLTKALFSFASKLAPVIIFVDEIDSLLGARGGAFEHEATRRMRNEFMAAWDGLRTKDSQRILILGATNRPFDLDDAVIRRLPRRIYVDLPDAKNREKILRIFLSKEKLESGFQYDKLAKETDGYSGSDLKNLCIAAAYRPVQELLEEEKGGRSESALLRALNLDDFIKAKAKVGPSVAYDATSMNELRKWNEQYGEGGSRRKSPFGF